MRKHCGPESKLTGELQKRIGRALQKGYSPEQAANTEVKEVGHVSIYRWLYMGLILQGNRAYLRHNINFIQVRNYVVFVKRISMIYN